MTTHVFIVDATTFPLHLQYLFAGTGAGDNRVDFNNAATTGLRPATENNLIAMIADGCRIRQGDGIIFYLQQNQRFSIAEGKFFGIFKAAQNSVFLDDNDDRQYLKSSLRKSLTFRILIEPDTVYAEGVTEWEALDEIKNIISPSQMLWSLIYRKLKGNRGNTMITPYETERLTQLIRNKNNRNPLNFNGMSLSFDLASQRITTENASPPDYRGRQVELNLLPRLIAKYRAGQSFEAHLQAYIMRNIGRGSNASLDNRLISDGEVEWLGNEVSCGVGMQRIDVMASIIASGQRILIPIELKAVTATYDNTTQIQRYIDWIAQYYLPNRPCDIQPVLIAKRPATRAASRALREFARAKQGFDQANQNLAYPLKYVEFYLAGGDLRFEEVNL